MEVLVQRIIGQSSIAHLEQAVPHASGSSAELLKGFLASCWVSLQQCKDAVRHALTGDAYQHMRGR